MSSKKSCPECRQSLAINISECVCGWKQPKTAVIKKRDYRCEYVIGERRCPLPGGISSAIHGSGTWFCGGHWRALSDPKLSEAILRDAEENYEQLMQLRKTRRNKLSDK